VNHPSRRAQFQRFSTSPWTVFSCVLLGGVLGWAAPAFSKSLSVVGLVYVDLLKMIVMPFMVSAVIFSLQKLFKDGGAGKILGRVMLVFVAFSVAAALTAAVGTLLIRPGTQMSASAKASMGKIVGANADGSNTDMALHRVEAPPKAMTLHDVFDSLIPSNIFASLANGETLKALVFALLFGFAVGQLPGRVAESLGQTLETVYHACQVLTRWVNLPVPLVLICMTASQIAETGLEPLRTMLGFVAAFLAVSLALLALALLVISRRSGSSFAVVVDAMRETFTLGVATNNSATCMPAMVDGLVERLNFARSRVELLVPLSVSLLRAGAIAYFVCGTLFIAALYSRELTAMEVGLVVVVSVLSGFASAGMAGILTISLIGTACNYLGLPFEAAFILFVAVDPICAMARTAVTVVGSCAAVSMVCAKPEPAAAPA
jgi:Na+/H+-dicarboxylate symporter